MGSSNNISLVLAIIMAISLLSFAQNSPQDYINAHNAARSEVGVGPMVWDERVASFAQNYANQRQADCQLVHSQNRPYGENLAWGTALTGTSAVNLWVGEKADYDYNTQTLCAPGNDMWTLYSKYVGTSVRLGCARVQCNSGACFIMLHVYEQNKIYYILRHNAARKEVGVGLFQWDATVAKFGESYANQRKDCALQHSHTPKYGENIAVGSGEFSGLDAVKLWVDEKADYDYHSNSCKFMKMRGHYTQVVGKNSSSIGCARVKCVNDAYFVTCNYELCFRF
ncbi:pathogenesis-related protein 1 [Tanacetum coccineum]